MAVVSTSQEEIILLSLREGVSLRFEEFKINRRGINRFSKKFLADRGGIFANSVGNDLTHGIAEGINYKGLKLRRNSDLL